MLSSQIEGTQSSLADLLLYEIDEEPGVPVEDAREVRRCVAALEQGHKLIREGLPLSMRLLRQVHKVLMSHPGGRGKATGELRRSQVWIGGTRPGNAVFVPPPADALPDCLRSLERFLNDEPEPTPPLIKAALAHVQFETIHPFLDGNGRVGRLLIVLQLVADGVLRAPMLIHASALQAATTANELSALVEADRKRIGGLGRGAASALSVHVALQRQPITSAGALVKATRLTAATVNKSLAHLERIGVVGELTKRRRGRVFSYRRYVEILGSEAIPA